MVKCVKTYWKEVKEKEARKEGEEGVSHAKSPESFSDILLPTPDLLVAPAC